MRALLPLVALALVAPVVAAETHHDVYGPAVGVWAAGASGAFMPIFKPAASWSQVTVTVVDDVYTKTYFTVCMEGGGSPQICGDDPADHRRSGINSVTLAPPGGIPAGKSVNVFVYTLYVGGGGPVALGTTGVVEAVFS